MKSQTELTRLCNLIRPDGSPAARAASGLRTTNGGPTVHAALCHVRDNNAGVMLLKILTVIGSDGSVTLSTDDEQIKAVLTCEGTGGKPQEFAALDIEDLLDEVLDVADSGEVLDPAEDDADESSTSAPDDTDTTGTVHRV